MYQVVGGNPVWSQVNSNGFGDADNTEISSLGRPSGRHIYAGTENKAKDARFGIPPNSAARRTRTGVRQTTTASEN